MQIENTPNWDDTTPETEQSITAPATPPAAIGEPSWEDTTPDVAPSPLPDFKIKLTPEQELQQKGLWEPGMGPLSGPNTPEDTAREIRALPQALEIPFAVLGKTVAAGARTVRDVLNPMTYLPPDQRPTRGIIVRNAQGEPELRAMTEQEIAERDPIQQGKPIFQFARTSIDPQGTDAQRMIEGLLTPENLALLPEAGGRAGAAALLAATAPGLVQQITQVVSGKGTEEQKRDAVNSLLIPALLMTRAHAFPEGRAVTTPGDLTESMQVPPPITLTGGEIAGRPKGAPAPIVPPVEIARATPEQAAAAASRMQRTATAAFEPRVGPPEVPATPAEVRDTQLQAIRKAGAHTRGDIQKLFSKAGLSNEEAADLRDAAWPDEARERAIQQAEATRKANLAAEEARRARIMAPALEPFKGAKGASAETAPKIEELIKTKPGDIPAQTIAALSDEDAKKLFEANAERGTATQHDAVLAGVKLTPADVPELQRMRDEAQKKALEAAKTGNNTVFLSNMGKVVWFNGAMEGALRKGPNFDLVMESEAAKAPKEEEQVTLYHGEGAQGGGGSDTRLFTKHPERAATYGPDVYTVTVPKSVADAAAAAAKKEGTGTSGDYVLPQEWVKKAEKMPSPPKQVVHEIPTGEEPTAAPAAPEPKYLGKPISYWEGIIENLPKGTERERLARSLGVANQPSKIIQYLRKRINDMRAAGVKPAKISFAAYIPPGQTVPEVGANHPEILKRLGIPGFETPESRNTPQFGFTDEEGNFLTREQAAERAKLTGQDLKEFEPGEPAHSDEIASPTEPTKPISEAKPYWKMSEQELTKAAEGGAVYIRPMPQDPQTQAAIEREAAKPNTPDRGLVLGKLYGYSDADIAAYYLNLRYLGKFQQEVQSLEKEIGKLAEGKDSKHVKGGYYVWWNDEGMGFVYRQNENKEMIRSTDTRQLARAIVLDAPQKFGIPERIAQIQRGIGGGAVQTPVPPEATGQPVPVSPATKPAKTATKAVKPATKPPLAAPITPPAEVAKPAPTTPEAPKAPAAHREPGKPFEPTWSPAFKKMIAERDKLKARLDEISNALDARITRAPTPELVAERQRIYPRYQQLQDAIFDEAWRQERAALPPATSSEPVVTPKVLKAQRADLLAQVDQAIKAAPETGEEKITFDVEGDGSFTVANTQAHLKAFRALAAKEFPTTVEKGAKVAGASTTKSGKPAPMPDASAEPDLTQTQKVVAQFTSEDPSRQTIQSAYADGSQIVATDGQQLIRFKGFSPGTAKNPVRVDSEGKVIDFGDQQFPNFSAVIPKDPTLVKGNVPTDSLWKMLRQASTFAASFDKEPAVQLLLNPDGSFGVKVASIEGDTFEHNVQKTSKDLGFYTAGPLFDGIDAMRRLGNDAIDIYAEGQTGPIEFNGKNAQYLRMPMKLEQHKETGKVRDNPDRIPPALAGTKAFSRDVPPPPVTPKVSMGPGAAARAEFEEGPPSIEAAGVDRIDMPVWDKAMARYRNYKEAISQLFTRRTMKGDVSMLSNAIYNIPRYFGQIAARSLRLRANDVQRMAVTFLMQSLKMSGDGLSAEDAERLGHLEHTGDPIGYLKTRGFDMKTAAEQFRNEGRPLNAAAATQAEQAMKLALANYNQLLPIARRARRQFDAQNSRDNNAGIDTAYENWYVPQRHDLDLMPTANGPIVLGDPRGGGSQAFQKAKVFEDYATAIEKGFVPRSLDIADLLEHRVNQGERMVQKKIFFDKLANYKDPVDGNPLVTKIPKRVIKRPDGDIRVQEHIPRGYEAIEPMPGIRLAVHKGYARLVRALTGNSQIGESALVGALQDLAAVEKHLGLALDTFHASRTLQAELALTGRVSIGSRLKRGLALVEYHPRDLDLAVKQGLITQQMADWVTKRNPMQVGGRQLELSPYQIVNIGARNGLQMARVADVMYREWTRQIPISGAVNKWVFDKMTRSAISQAFVLEFERVAKNNPHLNANGVGRMVAREINTFFGNIGKEGIFKNPSLSTLNQIIWLAPKWVEALATREARAAKQLGEIPFKLARGEQITIPTTLKGIGTGLGAYFVATQLLNLFTRHQFTFQNQEEGHKLDAWIPDVTGKTRGFFISPLSVFGEITHDIIRYAREKPDFITAVATILGNKLGNLARAGEILASGRDPVSGEKLLGSARRALTAAVQLVPAPISLSQVGRGIGHELFPGAVPAPAPGAVQRQLTSTIGFKTEPAGSAQQQVFNMVDAWKRSSPNHKIRYQLEQRQKQDFGPSDYRDMRNALIRGDLSQASRAYDKLLENRTPKDIRQTLEHPHPFTGSKQYERAFVSSLTPEQRQTYQAAVQERRALARTFEDMLRQRYANQRQVGAPSALSP